MFARHIYKNVRQCQLHTKTSLLVTNIRTSHLIGLSGNIALINKHQFQHTDGCILFVAQPGEEIVPGNKQIEVVINTHNTLDIGEDMMLVALGPVQFRDIIKHFPDKFLDGQIKGLFNKQDVFSFPVAGSTPFVDTITKVAFSLSHVREYVSHHQDGMCGLPLLGTMGKGCLILGIHSGGMDDKGYATCVERGTLESSIFALKKTLNRSPILSEAACNITLEMPVRKSMMHYEDLRGLEYMGKVPGAVLAQQKSKLQKTGMEGLMEDIIIEDLDCVGYDKCGKPMMGPAVVDGEYLSPFNISMRGCKTTHKPLDAKIMDKVIDTIVNRIWNRLKHKQANPLTLHQALNGVSSDAFTKGINANTSAGFGFTGLKNAYISIDENNVKHATADLELRVSSIIDTYLSAQSVAPVYDASLKDEPRKLKKCRTGETRVFFGAPLDHLLVSRMFLSPFYTAMVEDNETFCCAVGINMLSSSSTIARLLEHLSIIEGDYSKFDKVIPFDVSWAACTIMWKIFKLLGYNESAMKVIEGLLSDNLFVLICILQDLLKIAGLQPSGKYGTAEDNCLKNLIMIIYAWYLHPDLANINVFDCIVPVTYGDDVAIGVHSNVSSIFTPAYYADICRTEYEISFTDANKNTIFDFKSIHEVSFLKRTFEFDALYGTWFAPLSKDSLVKMLSWTIPSPYMSSAEQFTSALSSFCWELAIIVRSEHKYDTIVNKVKNGAITHRLIGAETLTPRYDDIIKVILSN